MHWSLERVLPPKPNEKDPTAQWTIEGITAMKAAKAAKETFMPIAGVHYKVLPAEDRILLPDLPALCSLRDRWFWKRRTHPHVPVWSYAKIPRSRFSPEENARLLSVYMRPWTLNPSDATAETPLLSKLQLHWQIPSKDQPASRSAQDASAAAATDTNTPKRRRLASKQQATTQTMPVEVKSYAAAWQNYISGNVVSEPNRRYIVNLLLATAARVSENPDDSSSEDEDNPFVYKSLASLDLVQCTLDGIAARSEEDGAEGFGKYQTTIRLGRSLWQTPALTAFEKAQVVTTNFTDNDFPSKEELTAAVTEAKRKNDDDVPQPFQGRTDPYSKYKLEEYSKRLDAYFAKLRALEKPPNAEQWDVLKNVHNRVLVELEIKNGQLKATNNWNHFEV